MIKSTKMFLKKFLLGTIVGLSFIVPTLALGDYNFTLPDQTGNAGLFLQTNGVNPLWAAAGGGGGGTVTSITFNSPLTSTQNPLTTAGTVGCQTAGALQNGCLTSTDWTTFNNKLSAVTADAPLSGAGTSGSHLVISQAGVGTNGYLSSVDWNTFNNKLSTVAVDGITITGNGTVGNPLVATAVATNPAAPDTSVQFNNGGAFGGSSNFVWDNAGQHLTVTGIVDAVGAYYSNGVFFANQDGANNIMIGNQSGMAITSGTQNIFEGFNAGKADTTGLNNVFIGYGAGALNTTGLRNTFIGGGGGNNPTIGAGGSNTTGTGQTFVGAGAGALTTGVSNTFIGANTGALNVTGQSNTFVGSGAGNVSLTNDNTYIGFNSGVLATSATFNAFLGTRAGRNVTTGSNNTIIGEMTQPILSTSGITTGADNVFLGRDAGNNISAAFTGSQNTFLGTGAGANLTTTNNSIALGFEAIPTANNQMVIGSNTSVIDNLFIGNGVTNNSPTNVAINATGAFAANSVGANLTLAGGKSTGTGASSNVFIQLPTLGTTGSIPQTLNTWGSFTNALVKFGDVDVVSNGELLAIVDNRPQLIFTVGSNSYLDIDQFGGTYRMGDILGSLNGDYFKIDDTAQTGEMLNMVKGFKMSNSRLETVMGAEVDAATDLPLSVGNVFRIKGSTTINDIFTADWQSGSQVVLIFEDAVTVTHAGFPNPGTATILLDGSANFSASTNSVLTLVYDGVTDAWQEMSRKNP